MKKNELLALQILIDIKEDHNITFLDETLEKAIKQLLDLEHYSHYTYGLTCTDRPDLLDIKFKTDYCWKLNFWDTKTIE